MARLVIFLLFFALPFSALASAVINEIAWMGTPNSAQDEWLELYSESGANLDGWILKTADGGMTINLSGAISVGGYFLIERTDDTTVPEVAADFIAPFGSGLNNSGEVLVLVNASGGEEDRVDASTGWPAGDNATKDTMQRSGTNWLTAPGTPRAQNTSTGNSPSTPPSPSAPEGAAPQPPASTASGSSISEEGETPKISAKILAVDTGIAGANVFFEGKAFGLDGKEITAQSYRWSFGDGGFSNGRQVSHTYKFPGIYHTSLTIVSGEYSASAYSVLTVIANELSISEVLPGADSWVEIRNGSSKRLDLTGWTIDFGGKTFSFPGQTFISANSYLVIPGEISGIALGNVGEILLRYPSGQKADSFSYGGNLSEGQSFTRIGSEIKVTIATPGKGEGKIAALPQPAPAPPKIQSVLPSPQPEPPSPEIASQGESQVAQVSQPFLSKSSIIWLLSALGVGLLAALGYLVSRRV